MLGVCIKYDYIICDDIVNEYTEAIPEPAEHLPASDQG
jgi:hypothetical protein